MASEKTVLVVFASWEDRCTLGLERDLKLYEINSVLLFFLKEYGEWTAENRALAKEMCGKRGILIDEVELSSEHVADSWRKMAAKADEHMKGGRVVIDFSTMPRESIWSLFWLADYFGSPIRYIYHRPHAYGSWLSSDPRKPRLVYKMSGIAGIGVRSVLLVIAGYDGERIRQLEHSLCPTEIKIGLQKGDSDPDNDARMEEIRRRFERHANVEFFELDSYSDDQGQAAIDVVLAPYFADSWNVIASSLGPKLSAVTLYRVFRQHNEIALAYAPSAEFNREYSRDIGESFSGVFKRKPVATSKSG